jgi:hypothetical protein
LLVEVDPALRNELLATFDGALLGAGEKHLLLRGALRFPLIRIDDYPSGVRPIPADLGPIHDVLMQFEARSVPYTLGIVPGILNEQMLDFLASLRCMLPAQHGFDHRYAKYSARLIARGDPWNQRGTVGAFNEFRFATYGTVVSKLRAGKELLEQRLRKPVSTYIPPCNVCDRTTSKALERLGFELCLCDKPVAHQLGVGRRARGQRAGVVRVDRARGRAHAAKAARHRVARGARALQPDLRWASSAAIPCWRAPWQPWPPQLTAAGRGR